MVNIETRKHTLSFTFDAGTSRGIMKEREILLLSIQDQHRTGLGEASPLPGLSKEAVDEMQVPLDALGFYLLENPRYLQLAYWEELSERLNLKAYPALQMAVEMALLNLNNPEYIWFQTAPLLKQGYSIPINGLIWMNEPEHMYQQGLEKWQQGYDCIKMKIGAIDFNAELEVLYRLRKLADRSSLILRVDANGAFDPQEAPYQLKELAKIGIHSIEQPIAIGQWDKMHELSEQPLVSIALDEELIGAKDPERMIRAIKPQYIVLKPTLLGGFTETRKWIALAEKHNIGWWITSALESNIGLNAIAQFVSTLNFGRNHQGLGTGSLYKHNIGPPCLIENGNLSSSFYASV